MRRGRSAAGFAVLALAGLLVAGCGGGATEPTAAPSPTEPKTNGLEKLSADEVIDRSVEASAAAETVHVAGEMKDDEGVDIKVDMSFKKDAGTVGHMLMDGMRVDIIRVDKDVYFKGSKKFWTEIAGDAQVASLLAGKWIKNSIDDKAMGGMAESTDPAHLFDDALDSNVGKASKGEPKKVDGELVLPLVGEDGATAYFALTGEPRILKIDPPKGEEGGVTFTYDESVEIKAPPADEVFDPKA